MKKNRFLFLIFFILLPSAVLGDNFTPKVIREIKIMEGRHFKGKLDGETNDYRLKRLEIELMGRSFENLPFEERIKRLKLASSKRVLAGTANLAGFSSSYTPKRIHNDTIYVVPKNDDVGIIDGLMKVYAPDLFAQYRHIRDRSFEIYSD